MNFRQTKLYEHAISELNMNGYMPTQDKLYQGHLSEDILQLLEKAYDLECGHKDMAAFILMIDPMTTDARKYMENSYPKAFHLKQVFDAQAHSGYSASIVVPAVVTLTYWGDLEKEGLNLWDYQIS